MYLGLSMETGRNVQVGQSVAAHVVMERCRDSDLAQIQVPVMVEQTVPDKVLMK